MRFVRQTGCRTAGGTSWNWRRGLLLLLAFAASLRAQSGAGPSRPHFSGNLVLVPDSGLLSGDLCVRAGELPASRFVLNAGLTLDSVSALDHERIPDAMLERGRQRNEGREYLVRDPRAARGVCVHLRGQVPVSTTNDQPTDWKGRIANWRGTLRMAEQTRWYPTPYDADRNVLDDVGTFALDVTCARCRGIYVNGATPVRGERGRFTSTVPRALLVHAGDVPITETAGALFVGAEASPATSAVLQGEIATIARRYSEWMRLPYTETPVFLSFTAVSRNYVPGRVQWQFVTWPTIAFSGGVPFDQLLTATQPARLPSGLRVSLAHEMGHFYFGTVRWPAGPLQWFGLESTAEYLSLRELLAESGQAAVAARQVAMFTGVATLRAPALREVREVHEIGDAHRYRLLPLAMWQLRRAVGDEAMFAFLRAIARGRGVFDLAAVRRAAAEARIPDALVEQWLVGPIDVAGALRVGIVEEVLAVPGAHSAAGVDSTGASVVPRP